MRNEQANEIGGRVFYTDATGAQRAVQALSYKCMQKVRSVSYKLCSAEVSSTCRGHDARSLLITGQPKCAEQCGPLVLYLLPCVLSAGMGRDT